MSSALTIPQYFPTEFATNWESVVQQKGGKVAQFATPDPSFKGKEKSYNQIDPIDNFQEITTRMGSTQLSEISGDKYWLRTRAYDDAKGFDEWDDDILGDIVLPTSDTMREMSNGWARKCDDVLFSELLGTRYIGETGVTTNDLPSGQKVAVNYKRDGTTADSGLTYEKILRALEIFGENDVDFDEEGQPVMFVRMRQITDLYASVTEFRSRDYSRDIEPFSKDKLITEGTMNWNGILFVKSQRVPTSGSDSYQCPMFTKRALKYYLDSPTPMIDVRPDLKHTLQIRMKGRIGAVRTQNELVVEVSCDETPGF